MSKPKNDAEKCSCNAGFTKAGSYDWASYMAPCKNSTDARIAATVLKERLATAHAALEAGDYAAAPARLADAGVSGGASYDGLIALTALEHDLEILTRDKRAERTYRALNAPYQLLP